MSAALLAVLLLLPIHAGAQCCGDCDGDGEVAIDELITAVNNALGTCGDATEGCPIDFEDDNSAAGTPDCHYVGRWNDACGAADLQALWRGDGEVLIVDLLGFDPGLFIGAGVTAAGTAAILGWYTRPDASDLVELGGSITLGAQGATLAVDPSEVPFDIDQCAFAGYRGALEDVIVPGAAPAARARRALDPAALARLRAVAGQRPRADFRRR